jgi:hypothetical protein
MCASEQAGVSGVNPIAIGMQSRILIELQLIALLLHQQGAFTEDLGKMRQDIADSLT